MAVKLWHMWKLRSCHAIEVTFSVEGGGNKVTVLISATANMSVEVPLIKTLLLPDPDQNPGV